MGRRYRYTPDFSLVDQMALAPRLLDEVLRRFSVGAPADSDDGHRRWPQWWVVPPATGAAHR